METHDRLAVERERGMKDWAEAVLSRSPNPATAMANKSSVLRVLVMLLQEHDACRR